MSKKLDSILNTMPPATGRTSVPQASTPQPKMVDKKGQGREEKKSVRPAIATAQMPKVEKAVSVQTVDEKQDRIVAIIPYGLKRQIKQYLVDHPGETEKTVLLKGLRAIGFSVSEEHLEDLRGKKSIK